jgi:aminoglycoside phosphotransferase (APT) family kinase protein
MPQKNFATCKENPGSSVARIGSVELAVDAARRGLVVACGRVGLEASRIELIRVGTNAVFRVGPDVVGRVVRRNGESAKKIERQVAVAGWLASIDFPATRLLSVDQPIVVDDVLVSLWESAGDSDSYAPIADVASVIRRLHDLDSPPGIDLPELRPFGEVPDPMPEFSGLDADDAKFLCSRITWARSEFYSLPFALPFGVLHGDANVGNVLRGRDGKPVLIDLDDFAVGPREWDLIQTAIFYDRFGWHSLDEYRTFVAVYGYDIMTWSGYSQLADMREVAMVSWIAKKAGESRGAAGEARKRINAMRSGGSRRDWGPY